MAATKKSKRSAKKTAAKSAAKKTTRKGATSKSAKRTASAKSARKTTGAKKTAPAGDAGVVYADVRRTLRGGLIGRLLGS